MRFVLGIGFSTIGLVLFLVGTLTPTLLTPGMSAGGQPRGTYFFFGLFACLVGVLIIFTDIRGRDEN